MKATRFLFSIVIVLVLLAMPSTSAKTAPYEGNTQNYGISSNVQGGNGDIEKFRKELLVHYDDLLALYPYIKNAATPGLLERINESKEWAKSLSQEELLQIKPVFDENPGIFEFPVQLLGIAEQSDALQRFSLDAVYACPATLPDDWCGCPAGASGGIQGVYNAKYAAQGFEVIHAFLPSDLVTVIAGAGGTVWAHPARIALRAAYEAAKAYALVQEGLDAVSGACHQGYQETLLVSHNEQVQWDLDHVVELRTVQLNVIELKEKREFLISAIESGVPVEGIEFLSVKYATNTNARKFIDITKSVSITMVEKGLYLVRLNGNGNFAASARFYTFEVKHAGDEVDHFGFVLFDRLGAK